jgi:hypothetical protein
MSEETKEPRTLTVVMGIAYPYKGEVLLPGVEYTLPYDVAHALCQLNHASIPGKGRYNRRDMRARQ